MIRTSRLIVLVVVALAALAPSAAQGAPLTTLAGGTFSLSVTPGTGYNASIRFLLLFKIPLYPQVACWLETEDGSYIQTIYVTHKGGRKDFYSAPSAGRPEALPVWYHRAAVDKDTDAVSAATAAAGLAASLTVKRALKPGNYVVFLEVNRSYDYNEKWTRANSGVNGQPSVIYRAVLTLQAGTETRASLDAFGTGSVDGSDGRIRPGLDGITTALTLIQDAEIRFDGR